MVLTTWDFALDRCGLLIGVLAAGVDAEGVGAAAGAWACAALPSAAAQTVAASKVRMRFMCFSLNYCFEVF